MKKSRTKISLLLVLIFALLIILTLSFVTLNVDHDCCGEDCPICALIKVAEDLLKTIVVIATFFGVHRAFNKILSFKKAYTNNVDVFTLIQQKVKLSN